MVRATANALRDVGVDQPEPPSSGDVTAYLASLGIRYRAPADARATGLADGSIDVCTTTSVLEHIPPDDLRSILVEVRRLLAPGGACSFAVDYHDHWAGPDASIDRLHFLRFDDDDWRRWNPDLQFQNRLRHGDYVDLFTDAGFALTEVDAVVDPAFPAEPVVADRFAGRDDLAIGDGWFLLTPADQRR
jgi:SAM-dependent methyltransferase